MNRAKGKDVCILHALKGLVLEKDFDKRWRFCAPDTFMRPNASHCGLKIKLISGHCDTAIIVEATAVS